MPSVANKGTFWRQAGLSYLQFVGVSSQALRRSLKVSSRATLVT